MISSFIITFRPMFATSLLSNAIACCLNGLKDRPRLLLYCASRVSAYALIGPLVLFPAHLEVTPWCMIITSHTEKTSRHQSSTNPSTTAPRIRMFHGVECLDAPDMQSGNMGRHSGSALGKTARFKCWHSHRRVQRFVRVTLVFNLKR